MIDIISAGALFRHVGAYRAHCSAVMDEWLVVFRRQSAHSDLYVTVHIPSRLMLLGPHEVAKAAFAEARTAADWLKWVDRKLAYYGDPEELGAFAAIGSAFRTSGRFRVRVRHAPRPAYWAGPYASTALPQHATSRNP